MYKVSIDTQAEKLLEIMLDIYDGNEYNFISVPAVKIPPHMQPVLQNTLETLKAEKLIMSYQTYINGDLFVTVTDESFSFLKEAPSKTKNQDSNATFFTLPSATQNLLKEIIEAQQRGQDIAGFLRDKIKNSAPQRERLTRELIKELNEKRYITVKWVEDMPYWGAVEPFGRTYFTRKKENEIKKEEVGRKIYKSGEIYSKQNKVVAEDILYSDIPAEVLIKQIYALIEQNGGSKTGDFKEMMVEVQDLIENINLQKSIPKNTALLRRLEKNFGQYKWFCGAVTQLVGKTVLELLPQV